MKLCWNSKNMNSSLKWINRLPMHSLQAYKFFFYKWFHHLNNGNGKSLKSSFSAHWQRVMYSHWQGPPPNMAWSGQKTPDQWPAQCRIFSQRHILMRNECTQLFCSSGNSCANSCWHFCNLVAGNAVSLSILRPPTLLLLEKPTRSRFQNCKVMSCQKAMLRSRRLAPEPHHGAAVGTAYNSNIYNVTTTQRIGV
jgi:hypothetical protein